MASNYNEFYKKSRRGNRGILSILTAPFRFAGRLLSRRRLPPENLGEQPVSISKRIVDLLLLPFRSVTNLTSSVWNLFEGMPAVRQRGAMLVGLCVIGLAVAPMFLMMNHEHRIKPSLTAEYENATKVAIDGEQFDVAQMHLKKLIELNPSDDSYRFQLAKVYLAESENQKADALIESLAPIDRTGYPPAHIYLAKKNIDLAKVASADREQLLKSARVHLEHATMKDFSNAEALTLASKLETTLGNPDEAIDYLSRAAQVDQNLLLDLAALKMEAGRKSDASNDVRRFIKYCDEHLEMKEGERWFNIGRSQLLLQDFDQAASALEKSIGFTEDPTELQSIKQKLSETHAQWAQTFDVERRNKEVLAQRLEHIDYALQHDLQNSSALLMLAELAFLDGESAFVDHETTERVQRLLGKVTVNGLTDATMHTIVGTNAAQAGENNIALQHLRRARELAPDEPTILNNLAWIHAHCEHPDLIIARELITAAAELDSENRQIRHTRGLIMLMGGENESARRDLEYALASMPDRRDLHEQLAEVYAKLGKLELSIREIQIAKSLRN